MGLGGWIGRITEAAAGILVGLATLMAAVEVFTRYVLNQSHFWVEALIQWLVLCAVWLMAGALLRRAGHVRVQVLISRLPATLQSIAASLVDVAGIMASLVFTWWVIQLIARTRALGLESLSGEFKIPEDVSYMPVALGSVLLAAGFLESLVTRPRSRGLPAGPADSPEVGA